MHYDSFAFARNRDIQTDTSQATILTRSGRIIPRRCPPRGWLAQPNCHRSKMAPGLTSPIDVKGINKVYPRKKPKKEDRKKKSTTKKTKRDSKQNKKRSTNRKKTRKPKKKTTRKPKGKTTRKPKNKRQKKVEKIRKRLESQRVRLGVKPQRRDQSARRLRRKI